ncbi:DUF7321 family protein [Haloarchaeobius sp. DT45]|uniref:DUF7321 family protein n=1 Tax=Haloarchaeobius sp. DT45 TaxID=3446116 RepID=UPI003F6CA60C
MVADTTIATVALALVTVSFPFYLYGAWIMIDAETVTWDVLTYHLKFIVTGLTLNTVPVVAWMGPRLFEQLGGLAALHAFLGLQAYALLVFALTGIVRIISAKRRYNLYHDPDQDVDLDDLGENMSHWRKRLRIGVFGYVVFWILAYVLGVGRYLIRYGFLEAPF